MRKDQLWGNDSRTTSFFAVWLQFHQVPNHGQVHLWLGPNAILFWVYYLHNRNRSYFQLVGFILFFNSSRREHANYVKIPLQNLKRKCQSSIPPNGVNCTGYLCKKLLLYRCPKSFLSFGFFIGSHFYIWLKHEVTTASI